MRKYETLKFWQKTHKLTLFIYKITSTFPRDELYGLTSQLRRASISIGSNIAEGSAKNSRLDYFRFMNISLGSLSEIEYQLLIAKDLNYISSEIYQETINEILEIKKMMTHYMGKSKTMSIISL